MVDEEVGLVEVQVVVEPETVMAQPKEMCEVLWTRTPKPRDRWTLVVVKV